jgi:hypothetical protein
MWQSSVARLSGWEIGLSYGFYPFTLVEQNMKYVSSVSLYVYYGIISKLNNIFMKRDEVTI